MSIPVVVDNTNRIIPDPASHISHSCHSQEFRQTTMIGMTTVSTLNITIPNSTILRRVTAISLGEKLISVISLEPKLGLMFFYQENNQVVRIYKGCSFLILKHPYRYP